VGRVLRLDRTVLPEGWKWAAAGGAGTNRRKSSVLSKVEHPFLTFKRLWGFAKVRYRGLAKDANRAFAMLAMLNINKWGRPLIGQVRPA
jgi:IS5 family transposase